MSGLLVAGCGGTVESDIAAQARQGDDKGYIAGDGTVQQIAAPDRKTLIEVTGTTLEGQDWSSKEA
ncbi:MAG: TlpA family protein disulfide reductase, partial [Ornithinimicrobium sp.]